MNKWRIPFLIVAVMMASGVGLVYVNGVTESDTVAANDRKSTQNNRASTKDFISPGAPQRFGCFVKHNPLRCCCPTQGGGGNFNCFKGVCSDLPKKFPDRFITR